jgi:hypothetical protein
MTEKTEAQHQTADTAQLTIGPQDLNVYANIIKAAIERGAFKAEEISQVGASYDKLTSFLKSISTPAEAEVNAESQEDSNQAKTEKNQ